MSGKGEKRQRRAVAAYALLQRAAELAAAAVDDAVQPHGVSTSQAAVLEALAAHGPQHQQELATRLGRSKAQLTALAEALEGKGLVRRERPAADRRFVTVTLTEAGRALLAIVEPARGQAVGTLMAALEGKQRRRLVDACEALVAQLAPALPSEPAADAAPEPASAPARAASPAPTADQSPAGAGTASEPAPPLAP
jgi:DNA-binding MarR family transcriptional regulator